MSEVHCSCGSTVARSGLAKHLRTQTCIARTAVARFHKRGWTEVGYGGTSEQSAFGIPIERARTRSTGNSYASQEWWPGWTRAVFNNWPGKLGARPEPDLLAAFVKKLLTDPSVQKAWEVCWESWSEREVTSTMVVDFARAAVGSVDADAEVRSAFNALHDALLRRSYG